MMPGMIMLWFGAVVNIPSGWHLCDGTVGTPDLRNKFVPCAGDEYDPGDNDANPQHAHTFTGDGHTHFLQSGENILLGEPEASRSIWTNEEPAIGTTDAEGTRPPYYALCYIMKL